ncbi:MAG: NAD(P)H-hydrate epimerase [Planctomyces sp.]|nr:NAD(P)H-hydrate epimerase [Planctomyces sp.]
MPRDWLSRDEVRAVDRAAISEYGLPGIVLMENAGRACAARLRDMGVRGPVGICCGKGNNGGDGAVIARHLDAWGIPVRVILAGRLDELQGDAAVHFGVIAKAGLLIETARDAAAWRGTADRLRACDWLVDALLGTGFSGEPRDPVRTAIDVMNESGRPILAVDVPSGMDADTGECPGACIRAARTVTFVARKMGFLNPASAAFTGPVETAGIGAPRSLLTSYDLLQECP